jgi:hypothetical protein
MEASSFYRPSDGVDHDMMKWRSQDWLVPEMKAEIEKHFPLPEHINESGQVDAYHLANAASQVFYKDRHFYNIYQVFQAALMFGAQWGFHIKIHSSWHIRCSYEHCSYQVCIGVQSQG